MNRTIFLSTCSLLSAVTLAASEPTAQPDFTALDANHDQKVSADEAAVDAGVAGAFRDLDMDQDGYLVRDEYEQLLGHAAAPAVAPPVEPQGVDPSIAGAAREEPERPGSMSGPEVSAELQPQPEEIIGKPLVGPDGESVGEIEQVARDQFTGEEVAVVTVGGFLGFFGKDVAVPVADLRVRADGAVHTALSEEELERLPEFAPAERS